MGGGGQPGHILTPVSDLAGPTQATRSCASDFACTAPSNPIGVAGDYLAVRRKYPLNPRHPLAPPNRFLCACLFNIV